MCDFSVGFGVVVHVLIWILILSSSFSILRLMPHFKDRLHAGCRSYLLRALPDLMWLLLLVLSEREMKDRRVHHSSSLFCCVRSSQQTLFSS